MIKKSTAKQDLDECNRHCKARLDGQPSKALIRWRQTTTAATTTQASSDRYRHGVPAVASKMAAMYSTSRGVGDRRRRQARHFCWHSLRLPVYPFPGLQGLLANNAGAARRLWTPNTHTRAASMADGISTTVSGTWLHGWCRAMVLAT